MALPMPSAIAPDFAPDYTVLQYADVIATLPKLTRMVSNATTAACEAARSLPLTLRGMIWRRGGGSGASGGVTALVASASMVVHGELVVAHTYKTRFVGWVGGRGEG